MGVLLEKGKGMEGLTEPNIFNAYDYGEIADSQVKFLKEFLMPRKGRPTTTITVREAMFQYGINNLKGRIYDLRQELAKEGEYICKMDWHYYETNGKKKKYGVYYMVKMPKEGKAC